MKNYFWSILVFLSLSSCKNENKVYRNDLTEIKLINDTTNYNYYPLTKYVHLIDSTSTVLMTKIDTVKDLNKFINSEFDDYKNYIVTRGFNDSINEILNKRENFKKFSKNEVRREIITLRDIYTSCVIDYMRKIEKKPGYNQPIILSYLTKEQERDYANLDVVFPTFYQESLMVIMLSDSLQYNKNTISAPNKKGNGISLSRIKSTHKDTIKVKFKAYDKKIRDTLNRTVITIY